MSFRTLGFILLVVTQVGFAHGRKPAVEDFVGIEVDQPEGTLQGSEGLFNFDKEINHFVKTKDQQPLIKAAAPVENSEGPNALTTGLTVALVLGLPGIIWFLMMNHLRQKPQVESASNIEVLEKYRRDRQDAKKTPDDVKKAS